MIQSHYYVFVADELFLVYDFFSSSEILVDVIFESASVAKSGPELVDVSIIVFFTSCLFVL